MAATWIKPLHMNKGKSIAQTLKERTDYANNPDKTIDRQVGYIINPGKTASGDLVKCFACDPHTVDTEFLITKREYDYITGRDQRERNILAYHIRQSFKPGEITPQEALEVGYELVSRFTKNQHAFIVAVHTDKAHVHCHAVFNSTTLDSGRKFKNFWGSSFAVRRLSDLICAEHGLSIIENPKPSKGQNYATWLGDKKPSNRQILQQKIEELLPVCTTFDGLLDRLKSDGFEVNTKRKHISVKAADWGKPVRLNSLGDAYTQAAICARLGKARMISSSSDSGLHTHQSGSERVSLLIDIQAKIREGKGAGYEQWAKIFSLKQAAKTLVFLQENGIDSYEDLKQKASAASAEFSALTGRIKEIEGRQKEISELQKNVGQYSKTREVYSQYKTGGWKRRFYDEHTADILLHRAAKKYFDSLGLKKLPSMKQLKQEYATLAAEKKKLYGSYHATKENSRDLNVARGNADRILGIHLNAPARENPHVKRYDLYEK
ncbi:relaxase/mobilization nuclease domain-containing protein [Ruminococcaceae bacterium OttesenSCG-928-L11]|nr:relaxase/mobilization nuclease domain-containing protein [Ruminococcaceae bacterium OttesenSCG-928-L11]